MREMGKAMMGTGEATGDRRAVEAAEAAISNPLLDDVSLKGARALLINITGGPDMTLFEVDEAANRVREEVDPEANIIFGSTFNETMEGRMRVSVVATGIDAQSNTATTGAKFNAAAEPRKNFAFSPAAVTARTEPVMKVQAPRASGHMPEYARAPEQPQQPQARVERPAEPIMEERAPVQQPVAQAPMHEPEQEAPRAPERVQPREPAAAVHYHEEAAEAPRAAQSYSPRREYREPPREDSGRGFFQRMADVGRALSATRPDMPARPVASERVQVVQKPAPVATATAAVAVEPERMQAVPQKAPAADDQYLDIPAFLRRQAN
jgi:cell division protein FtsZ